MANKWRLDKTDPYSGSCRGRLAVAWLAADVGEIIGVGYDANGRVVKGAGNTGIVGVCVLADAYPAGKQIDVLQSVELVDGTGLVAGTSYTISNAGVIAATAAGVTGNLGWTETADRLIVRHRRV